MKISKSILESIIRQIIREQEEDVEPSETDMRNAYASFLQAAESSAWGKAVAVVITKITMGILERVTRSGTLSISEFNDVAVKAISSDRVRDLVKGISDQALEASTIYQESSDASKRIARTSFHRVVDVAIGSVAASEIAFCILYDMQGIDGIADALEHEESDSARYAASNGQPIQHTPRERVDNTEIKAAVADKQRILSAARNGWEAIIKFVAMTYQPNKENSHLAPFVDPAIDPYDIFSSTPPF